MRILLVCGKASALQGWGNMETTRKIKRSLEMYGHNVIVLHLSDNKELMRHLEVHTYDLVWSSIYYFTEDSNCINNLNDNLCVTDILETMNVPFIGSRASALRNMIDKKKTISILRKYGLTTHKQMLVPAGTYLENVSFSKEWIVKPCYEAESNGIDEGSIVHNMKELNDRMNLIWSNYNQPALVERYLCGDEYTAAVIGNRGDCKVLPIKNIVNADAYKKYPIITQNLKIENKLTFEIPHSESAIIRKLCVDAMKAIGFKDFVRIDIRKDSNDDFKIIEVNGIPGLNPRKSRIYEIYDLYNKNNGRNMNYINLINEIVQTAKRRVSAIPERTYLEVVNETKKAVYQQK